MTSEGIFGKKLAQLQLIFTNLWNSKIVQLVLSGLSNNALWWRSSIVLLAMASTDFVWGKYVSGISTKVPFIAALWSIPVMVFGAYVTVSYVQDKRLIIPAAIGAFIGTYLAVN